MSLFITNAFFILVDSCFEELVDCIIEIYFSGLPNSKLISEMSFAAGPSINPLAFFQLHPDPFNHIFFPDS